MTASSKAYAQELGGMRENFICWVLSMASICGALRFFWSFLLEKYSYKRIYGTLIIIQIIIGFTIPVVLQMDNGIIKQTLFCL